MGTANTLAAVEASAGTAIVAPHTGTAGIRPKVTGKAFFARGTYSDEVRAIIKHARAVGLAKVALVYPDDPFGRPIVPVYEQATQAEGAENVATVKVASVNSTEFSEAIARIKAAKPDVVIAYLSQTFPEFLSAYREAHVAGQLYGISLAYGTKLMSGSMALLRGVGITQTTPSPWDETKPIVREYLEARRLDGGKVAISFGTLEGYIGARLMIEALRRAGKDPTRESVREALARMQPLDVGGFTVPNEGDGKSYVEIGVLDQQGRYRR
jgi:branched-chain amino acid transport system substrate-binding protein